MQNILIIDDDSSGAQLMITLLQLQGHHARRPEDWKDPLSDWEKLRPPLVIIDVHLRARNGLDLLRQIRSHPDQDLARTPVLMISADNYQYECRQAGASSFLLKPFGYQDLLCAVQSVEEGSLAENKP